MAREAVDFLRMGNGDQDMKEAESEVDRNPSGSRGPSPEREKEQLPRSALPSEGETPGEVESKAEERKSETEAEGQAEAKKARNSPPRSPGLPSDVAPATGGFQVTEEEYRLVCQFRGMEQQQQQQAKFSQARQAGAQERSATVSPTRNGGEAPSTSTPAAATSGLLLGTFNDQHNRNVQAKFAQALQAESQNKQDSSAAQAHSTRPYTSTSAAALSLAIPAAANGQHFQSGFAQQGGFGSPIPGLQRSDGRHPMLNAQEPNPSAYMASANRVLQSSTVPRRSGSPQPAAPPRSNGTTVPGGRVSAQLTIFYAGQVNVYDDVPVDKARAIMLLAGNESTFSYNQPPGPTVTAKMPIVVPSAASAPAPSSSSGGLVNPVNKPTLRARVPPGITPELPQARKVSLARFLEKRKDRARTKAPYSSSNSEKKFAHFDRPPSPQSMNVIGHSSCPPSGTSPMKVQPICGEPALPSLQGHGSEDHGGVSRMRCSGIEVGAGSDGPKGASGLQPQLQQQQLQIH